VIGRSVLHGKRDWLAQITKHTTDRWLYCYIKQTTAINEASMHGHPILSRKTGMTTNEKQEKRARKEKKTAMTAN